MVYGFCFNLYKKLYPGKRLQNDYKTLFPKQHYNYNHLKIKIIQNLIIQNIVLYYIYVLELMMLLSYAFFTFLKSFCPFWFCRCILEAF